MTEREPPYDAGQAGLPPLTDAELSDLERLRRAVPAPRDTTLGQEQALVLRLVAEVRRLRARVGTTETNLTTALAFERAAERQADSSIDELRRLRAVYQRARPLVVSMEDCEQRNPNCCIGHALKDVFEVGPDE